MRSTNILLQLKSHWPISVSSKHNFFCHQQHSLNTPPFFCRGSIILVQHHFSVYFCISPTQSWHATWQIKTNTPTYVASIPPFQGQTTSCTQADTARTFWGPFSCFLPGYFILIVSHRTKPTMEIPGLFSLINRRDLGNKACSIMLDQTFALIRSSAKPCTLLESFGAFGVL